MQPGEACESILLALVIADFEALRVRIIRNLVEVASCRSGEAELVSLFRVVSQRREYSSTRRLIVKISGGGRLEAVVGSISVGADVVSEGIGMIAKTEMIVGLVEAAVTERQFCEAGTLEAGTRRDVEDSVCAISIIGAKRAALCFDKLDVLRIELRTHIAGDIRVRDGNAIDRPCDLVSAAYMQLIVNDRCTRHVVGDGRETVGAV